jgi:hypothetical protein
VIVPSLLTGLESAVKFAGEVCRLSPFCARVRSKPLSTLRQHPDCYRGLDLPGREPCCPDQSVRFNVLIEREMTHVLSLVAMACAVLWWSIN